MDERPKLDRTWLCSVVFVDIVHYSMQSVTLEMNWKGRLNRYLVESIQDVPEADRVILDTGDGAAICFLGDPEAAMFCALRLLASFVREDQGQPAGMRVRIGINLGPVKLVKDLNGNLNAIGDGINVGQRVMSFAAENQILVSRSFYEVASRLSESYGQLFKYAGVRKDKNVREHAVYELRPLRSAGQASRTPTPGQASRTPTPGQASRTPAPGQASRTPAPGQASRTSPGQPSRTPSPGQPSRTPQPSRAPSGTSAAPPAPFPAEPQLDAAVLERIERGLAPILGPIARHLVRDASARATTPVEVCRALIAYIPQKIDQERFLGNCEVVLEPPPREPAPPPDPGGPVAIWDVAALEHARRELAIYMGPVARFLVDRAAARARSEEELWDLLAAEIASPPDRERFRASAPASAPHER